MSKATNYGTWTTLAFPQRSITGLMRLVLGDAPTQFIPDIGGSALMPGAWDLGDDAGLFPSPGFPLSTHFEDALGEGLDSWYDSVEGAMAGLPTMPASPSMSEWEDWLQSRGSLDVDC
ncbi:hypothetical protein LTR12_018099 [Friedmanniomyces endolithicus]|nr:hypothetical protein LTR12_018099 [Friedmanniomyces endolithicus]